MLSCSALSQPKGKQTKPNKQKPARAIGERYKTDIHKKKRNPKVSLCAYNIIAYIRDPKYYTRNSYN